MNEIQPNGIFLNKYRILEKIGEGSFSHIFKGISLKTGEFIALKMEKVTDGERIRILKRETTLLNYLAAASNNIPKIHWFGNIGDFAGLIIPYYDYSLYDWYKRTPFEKRISKIDNIRLRMVDILHIIHSKNVIHRDIKPHNFMVKNHDIYLIDFGLAIFYKTGDGGHIENQSSKEIVGTPNYISLFVHEGHTPSRRDDMISLEYICMLLRGELVWEHATNIAEYKKEHLTKTKNVFIKRAYTIAFKEPPYYT
jgi:serine/threonine protein kinase